MIKLESGYSITLILITRLTGFHWTYVCACTAVSTQIRIDGVLVIAFADGFYRALVSTYSTGNTFVVNYISHAGFLLCSLVNNCIIKNGIFFVNLLSIGVCVKI